VRNTRMMTTLLALCAIALMSAVATATASAALPEQSPATGTFKVTSGKSAFQLSNEEKVTCTGDTGEGKLTGAKTSESTVKFEGCEALGFKCSSSGAKSGVIETSIDSTLVYLAKEGKATKTVGEDLQLAKEVSITCLIVTLKVKGSTLCPLTPINTKTKSLTLTCKQTKGIQEYTEYENEKGEILKDITETTKSGKTFQSGLESTESLALSTEGEVKG
jgi:hypothetical protein